MSQLPVPNNNAPAENPPSIVSSICSDSSFLGAGLGGPGGAAGGVYTNIPDGEIIHRVENTYLPAGSKSDRPPKSRLTGTIEKFVVFDGKIIPIEIAVYLRSMIDAAKKDGIRIQVTSGFRTMAQQQEGWSKYPGSWARPGWSPHQRGYAVDMSTRGGYSEQFGGGRYMWLVKNAYRFGFIRTVKFERWHWEFRGNWVGQPKPRWANDDRWKKLTQFQVVPRTHICGTGPKEDGWTNGSTVPVRYQFEPDKKAFDSEGRSGAVNTWTDEDGSHIPDKLDRLYPGWDKLGPATIESETPTETPTETPQT